MQIDTGPEDADVNRVMVENTTLVSELICDSFDSCKNVCFTFTLDNSHHRVAMVSEHFVHCLFVHVLLVGVSPHHMLVPLMFHTLDMLPLYLFAPLV